MNEDEVIAVWGKFCEGNDFELNPDVGHVRMIAKGVLENEKKFGLKLCPCRIRDGSRKKDLELICPCNFKTHSTWLQPMAGRKAMCWCGLFVSKL